MIGLAPKIVLPDDGTPVVVLENEWIKIAMNKGDGWVAVAVATHPGQDDYLEHVAKAWVRQPTPEDDVKPLDFQTSDQFRDAVMDSLELGGMRRIS